MRFTSWALLCAALLSSGGPAEAVPLGIRVAVLRDSGSGFVAQGAALGGGPTLDVAAAAGDTLRLLIELTGTPSDPGWVFWDTEVNADDPTEIDYAVGSGTELSGLGFDRAPDATLDDANPSVGVVRSLIDPGGVPYGTGQLYRIDYVVQPGVAADGASDVTIELTSLVSSGGSDSADPSTSFASLRVNVLPEPSILLLLAAGGGIVLARRRAAARAQAEATRST